MSWRKASGWPLLSFVSLSWQSWESFSRYYSSFPVSFVLYMQRAALNGAMVILPSLKKQLTVSTQLAPLWRLLCHHFSFFSSFDGSRLTSGTFSRLFQDKDTFGSFLGCSVDCANFHKRSNRNYPRHSGELLGSHRPWFFVAIRIRFDNSFRLCAGICRFWQCKSLAVSTLSH